MHVSGHGMSWHVLAASKRLARKEDAVSAIHYVLYPTFHRLPLALIMRSAMFSSLVAANC